MAFDIYTPTKVSDLTKGEYFTLRPNTEVVYVKGPYDKSAKAWMCPKAEDFCIARILKGDTIVYTGFTY